MCEEKDVRKSISSIAIIKSKEFEMTVGVIFMQCMHKVLDEFLDECFTQDYDFSDYEDMNHACVEVGGNT